MISDRDVKFYTAIAISLLALAFIVRCYMWFANVPLEIPYVDPFLKAIGHLIGYAVTSFSRAISP